MDFKFPELDPTKTITYVVHADDTTNAAAATYDMILGMDLMTEIGIYVNTDDKIVVWKDRTIPLKEQVDIDGFVQELDNLSSAEKADLAQVLKQFPTLFGGGLGHLNIPQSIWN